MTTRKYHRTTLEAFGCDASNSNPIEGPYRGEFDTDWMIVSISISIIIGLLFSVWKGWI